MNPPRQGFTLIELVVSLFLMSLMVALVGQILRQTVFSRQKIAQQSQTHQEWRLFLNQWFQDCENLTVDWDLERWIKPAASQLALKLIRNSYSRRNSNPQNSGPLPPQEEAENQIFQAVWPEIQAQLASLGQVPEVSYRRLGATYVVGQRQRILFFINSKGWPTRWGIRQRIIYQLDSCPGQVSSSCLWRYQKDVQDITETQWRLNRDDTQWVVLSDVKDLSFSYKSLGNQEFQDSWDNSPEGAQKGQNLVLIRINVQTSRHKVSQLDCGPWILKLAPVMPQNISVNAPTPMPPAGESP